MNCLSLNIRGCGETHKLDWLRRLKQCQKIDFMGLQETRVADSNQIDLDGVWGNNHYDMEFVNPTGRSGGIVSIWDPGIFSKNQVFSSRNYIAITGNWKGINGVITVVNVYAPQSKTDKRKLWSDLLELMKIGDGIWIFVGDFNVVRYANERINSRFCRRMAKDFNEFIAKAGLMEFSTGGYKFTYKCDDGLKLSKLDRILVCSIFIAMQMMSIVNVLDREYSDHAPVVLKPSCQDFGPPSFRFFNSWMLRDGFNEEFENAWNYFMGFGSPDMFIKARLKHVKNCIRKWRQVDSNDESKLLLNSKTKVAELESIAEFRALKEDELLERRKCKTKISELEQFSKLDMQQKAKVKWLTDGDENTAFFHGSVKSKNQKNRIHGMYVNGVWCSDPIKINK